MEIRWNQNSSSSSSSAPCWWKSILGGLHVYFLCRAMSSFNSFPYCSSRRHPYMDFFLSSGDDGNSIRSVSAVLQTFAERWQRRFHKSAVPYTRLFIAILFSRFAPFRQRTDDKPIQSANIWTERELGATAGIQFKAFLHQLHADGLFSLADDAKEAQRRLNQKQK